MIVLFFPTSIECSFKRKARNVFLDEKYKTSLIPDPEKMGLVLPDSRILSSFVKFY